MEPLNDTLLVADMLLDRDAAVVALELALLVSDPELDRDAEAA